jgi:4-hydroxy-tetrahydrodipicolinate reductase
VNKTSVHVHGAGGRMGQACVAGIAAAADLALAGTSGRHDDLAAVLARVRPDVVVEFTVPSAVAGNLEVIARCGCHAVCGTTGLSPDAARALGRAFAAQSRALVLAANFAIGAVLLQRFAREAVRWFPDVEIVELHHEQKLDAPSGTALATARQIAAAARAPLNAGRPGAREAVPAARGGPVEGVPIHSVRLPGLLAHQEVLFGAAGQLLSLRHDTTDRRAFVPGVLLAVRSVPGRAGLIDGLEPLLG